MFQLLHPAEVNPFSADFGSIMTKLCINQTRLIVVHYNLKKKSYNTVQNTLLAIFIRNLCKWISPESTFILNQRFLNNFYKMCNFAFLLKCSFSLGKEIYKESLHYNFCFRWWKKHFFLKKNENIRSIQSDKWFFFSKFILYCLVKMYLFKKCNNNFVGCICTDKFLFIMII